MKYVFLFKMLDGLKLSKKKKNSSFSETKPSSLRGRSGRRALNLLNHCGPATPRTLTSACASPSTRTADTGGTRDTAADQTKQAFSAKFQVSF